MRETTTPRQEERDARAQERILARARREAARSRDRDWHSRLALALSEIAGDGCRCGLRSSMSREELRALAGGCTEPHHVCSRLDRLRRRLGQ